MKFNKNYFYALIFLAGILVAGLATKKPAREKGSDIKLGYENRTLEITQTPKSSLYLFETKTPQFAVSLARNDQFIASLNQEASAEREILPETRIKISRKGAEVKTALITEKSLVKPVLAKGEKSITITEVLPDVDLSYEVVPEGVKEKVILKDRSAPNEYLFDFEATNIKVKMNVLERTWFFIDKTTDKPLFYIPRPFAVDARGEKTGAVKIHKVIEGDREFLKLVLDKRWLLAKERVFPVVIDPSIEVPEEKEELVAARSRTSKTFKEKESGAYTYKGSTGPIHFHAKNGNWEEIDTLIGASADPAFALAAPDNDFQTYFKKSPLEEPFLKLRNRNSALSVSLIKNLEFNQQQLPPTIEDNTITYPQVLNGIDFRYLVRAESFLEEFVVKSPQAAMQVFNVIQKITIPSAYYRKNPDGSIDFLDQATNKLLWFIPPPKLYEFSKETFHPIPLSENYGVEYRIEQIDENTFLLQKILREEGRAWLWDSQRIYPLVVDASIITKDIAATNDNAESWGTSYPSNGTTGRDAGWGSPTHHLYLALGCYSSTAAESGWRFQNITIAKNATINSAKIEFVSKSDSTKDVDLTILGEDADNCSNYSASWPNSRTSRTTATTRWDIGTTSWSNGFVYDTPDFSGVVSEITSRTGWSSTNAMCIMTDNYATALYDTRGVFSYNSDWPEDQATLTIHYVESDNAKFNNAKLNNIKVY